MSCAGPNQENTSGEVVEVRKIKEVEAHTPLDQLTEVPILGQPIKLGPKIMSINPAQKWKRVSNPIHPHPKPPKLNKEVPFFNLGQIRKGKGVTPSDPAHPK